MHSLDHGINDKGSEVRGGDIKGWTSKAQSAHLPPDDIPSEKNLQSA